MYTHNPSTTTRVSKKKSGPHSIPSNFPAATTYPRLASLNAEWRSTAHNTRSRSALSVRFARHLLSVTWPQAFRFRISAYDNARENGRDIKFKDAFARDFQVRYTAFPTVAACTCV